MCVLRRHQDGAFSRQAAVTPMDLHASRYIEMFSICLKGIALVEGGLVAPA